tara:strand:+ start:1355 stop:2272 length:918 start_codon:yes stop_codon:yes gene_type:complete
MNSRRNFIKKSSLITAGVLNYNFTPIVTDVNGVDISVITYSFNTSSEETNVIIQNCIDSGIDNIELMGNHIEKTMGISRYTRSHADWRANVTNRQLKSMRKFFNDNGINIFAFKPNCIDSNNTDGEIEYAMRATKALGADFLMNELLDNDDIDRVNYFADKHKVKVGYHTHHNNLGPNKITTDDAWDYALSSSKYNFINLDIGHYINVRGNTKESLIEFIKNKNNKICSLHLKDRQFGKYANPGVSDNQIWGFGETPIDKVLRLMRDRSYKFTATIELEYRVPEGSNRVKEVKRCLEYCKTALSS